MLLFAVRTALVPVVVMTGVFASITDRVRVPEEMSANTTPTAITCVFERLEIQQPPVVIGPAIKFTETVPLFSNTLVDNEMNQPTTTKATSFTATYVMNKAIQTRNTTKSWMCGTLPLNLAL